MPLIVSLSLLLSLSVFLQEGIHTFVISNPRGSIYATIVEIRMVFWDFIP